jgi:hypothetical protein
MSFWGEKYEWEEKMGEYKRKGRKGKEKGRVKIPFEERGGGINIVLGQNIDPWSNIYKPTKKY